LFASGKLISQCDDESVPQVKFNFKGIDALADLQKDEVTGESADVFGGGREADPKMSSVS
jgi:hypothetical protein